MSLWPILTLLLLLLPGCERAPDTRQVRSIEVRSIDVRPSDPAIHYTGWFDRRDPNAPRFAWPGTQITVELTGGSLLARFTDTPVEDDTRETDWITVVVDQQPPKAFALAEGSHVYPLAKDLAKGVHRVVIWKRTEAEVGVITFHGFVVNGGGSLRPPAPMRRRMIFIGDSITAGYGNEGRDSSCHWSAAAENNYETYGAHAARALAAEYVAMAWSGKGLTRNYEARDRSTLPELYERTIPSEPDSPRIPDARADVVVVNLGTNDFFQGLPEEDPFIRAYAVLLQSLRRRYPDALIVLGLGPMLADDYPQPNARSSMRSWLETVRKQRAAAGDARTAFIELWTDPADGMGCDFHPNKTTHARLGRELAKLVRAKLGW